MLSVVITVHIIACVALILIVLLQTGKGSEMGAAFGGSSQTIFGSSGPGSFLEKMTAAAAIIFVLTSLTMGYFSSQRPSSSIMEETPRPVEQSVPEVPTPLENNK